MWLKMQKTVLGTWFYTVRRKRTLEFRRRKKLLCRTKWKFYDSIPSSKEGFSRISHRGKPQWFSNIPYQRTAWDVRRETLYQIKYRTIRRNDPETWFDRPLSVAGRIIIEENGQIKDQLVNIDRDLMIIPNLAIHMSRSSNESKQLNPQKISCHYVEEILQKMVLRKWSPKNQALRKKISYLMICFYIIEWEEQH